MAGEDGGRHEAMAVAAAVAPGRDGLGRLCLGLHLAIIAYFISGWLAPWREALVFYLVFVPAVALQWQFNADACVLNNLESWLRTRQWRDPGNREEGAWLATLAEDHLGFRPGPLAMDIFSYAGLGTLWSMSLIHLLYFLH